MRYLPNIDKSGFRPGEYVGYANGVWRIRRAGRSAWRAISATGRVLSAPSLTQLSSLLTQAAKAA